MEKSPDARALFDAACQSAPPVNTIQIYPLKQLFHNIDALPGKCIVGPVAFQLLYEWKREDPVRCNLEKNCF